MYLLSVFRKSSCDDYWSVGIKWTFPSPPPPTPFFFFFFNSFWITGYPVGLIVLRLWRQLIWNLLSRTRRRLTILTLDLCLFSWLIKKWSYQPLVLLRILIFSLVTLGNSKAKRCKTLCVGNSGLSDICSCMRFLETATNHR